VYTFGYGFTALTRDGSWLLWKGSDIDPTTIADSSNGKIKTVHTIMTNRSYRLILGLRDDGKLIYATSTPTNVQEVAIPDGEEVDSVYTREYSALVLTKSKNLYKVTSSTVTLLADNVKGVANMVGDAGVVSAHEWDMSTAVKPSGLSVVNTAEDTLANLNPVFVDVDEEAMVFHVVDAPSQGAIQVDGVGITGAGFGCMCRMRMSMEMIVLVTMFRMLREAILERIRFR
jgi:hypothetical protein